MDIDWYTDKVSDYLEKKFKKYSKKAVKKAVKKVLVKTLPKFTAKCAAKKIPVVGAITGAIFGGWKAIKGDWKGAGMEVSSGAASCVPGAGTAASVALDIAELCREVEGEVA